MLRPLVPLAIALALGASGRAATELVLNEVLYDPIGADGDAEFVELMAVGPDPIALDGLSLQFCNGASPGHWETLWTAPDQFVLAGGSLLLLGEAGVAGADVTLALDLQNGPDALRLLRGETVLDLLGYGEGLDPALYEAWPAEDVSGRSLARRPDGVDTDQNALDWFPADPSPGDLNLPDFRLRIERAEAPWAPLAPGAPCTLSVRLRNGGGADWPADLTLDVDGVPRADLPALAPEGIHTLALALPPLPSGESTLLLSVAGGDSLALPLRVGLGPLMLSEVLFAPLPDEPEWVEFVCRAAQSGLEYYQLRDLGGTAAEFRAPPALAGERFLLTGDRAALLAARPQLDPARVLDLAPWPSLANSGEATPGWTEALALDDASGRRVDGLRYRGDWIPERGWSIERLEAYPVGGLPPWAPAATGSTPLVGSPATPDFAGTLQLWPNPFDPERERLWIELRAPGETLTLRFFDAAGRRVQSIEGSLAAGRVRLPWDGRAEDGRALPDGAYPLLLRWMNLEGRAREALVVVGLLRRSDP